MQKTTTNTLAKVTLTALSLSMAMLAQANLTNYNDPNTDKLLAAMANSRLHIVQLGDSHTAGDSMTQALREKLQARFGNGGMGWAMPMYFSGQRMAKYGYDNYQWTPISSRSNQSQDYTIGGLLAKPKSSGSTLTLKSKTKENPQEFVVSIKQSASDGVFTGIDADGRSFTLQAPIKNGTWQTAKIQARLPLTITAQGEVGGSYIGGWWGFDPSGRGALVSALGINGAHLSHWSRWNDSAWQGELATIAPEVVALAYGTNEAYGNISASSVKNTLTKYIRDIRQASPNSVVLIIGAPEALKGTAGSCGTRPTTLSDIQRAQREVAQSENTLYWDWQQAMGGSCSMKNWMNQGLASKDGVHFTVKGYTRLGQQLADDLLTLANNGNTAAFVGSENPTPAVSYRSEGLGFGLNDSSSRSYSYR